MDRTEDGKPFTWFSQDQLWTLQTHLLWTPTRTGHHNIDARYVDDLSIRKAVSLQRWQTRQRERESEALKKAHEDARKRAH